MSELLQDALAYAVDAHENQDRKGKSLPYAAHPVGVGTTLHRYGFGDEIVAAGFLHDTVEDTDVTLDDIEQRFGTEIAGLVEGASEHDKDAPWEERKRHTIQYLSDAPRDVAVVTCADKLDNVKALRHEYRDEGDELWERFERPYEKQEWYYTSVTDRLDELFDDGPERLLYQELRNEVDALFGGE
ncbi:MAG: HD domain-containing protein [Candidatus Nanohaloarchaea archaeon]|nr:HD domain-containing protein [Candidatus Nanohaloarchaea archaeon]